MDGFKTLPKMQHFKEGGHAKAEYCGGGMTKMKEGGDVDMKQDKALIKKAFKQHDKAEHDKEPTEIKLKKGGRSKKEKGTVKKFKAGGEVKNVYEAKKSSGDLDNIEKVKDIKPKKAAAPSKAAEKPAMKGSDVAKEKSKPAGDAEKIKKVPPTGNKKAEAASGAKEMPNKYKKGGGVKKLAGGGDPGAKVDDRPPYYQALQAEVNRDKYAREAKIHKYAMDNTPEDNYLAKHQAPFYGLQSYEAPNKAGARANYDAANSLANYNEIEAENMSRRGRDDENARTSIAKKKGGKIKKYADGRKVSDPNAVAAKASMELEDALSPISMARELARKTKNYVNPSLPAGYGNLGMPGQLPVNPSMNQYQMQAPQNPGMQPPMQQGMPQQNPMAGRIPGMN